jgi:hypothetical protein
MSAHLLQKHVAGLGSQALMAEIRSDGRVEGEQGVLVLPIEPMSIPCQCGLLSSSSSLRSVMSRRPSSCVPGAHVSSRTNG